MNRMFRLLGSFGQAGRKSQTGCRNTAKSQLDQEAVAAVEATKTAIAAIDTSKPEEAIQALERATGKLDILLARNPHH